MPVQQKVMRCQHLQIRLCTHCQEGHNSRDASCSFVTALARFAPADGLCNQQHFRTANRSRPLGISVATTRSECIGMLLHQLAGLSKPLFTI